MNGRHHFFDDRSHGVGMQKVPPPPHFGCWSTVDEATHRGIRNANFCSFHHTFD